MNNLKKWILKIMLNLFFLILQHTYQFICKSRLKQDIIRNKNLGVLKHVLFDWLLILCHRIIITRKQLKSPRRTVELSHLNKYYKRVTCALQIPFKLAGTQQLRDGIAFLKNLDKFCNLAVRPVRREARKLKEDAISTSFVKVLKKR